MQKKVITILVLLFHQLAFSSLLYAGEQNWYAKGIQAERAGDYQSAIAYFTKSANNGLSDASYALGRLYRLTGDDEKSLEWFQKSALARNTFAQYEVGVIYLYGSSATPADTKEALKWFTFAAKGGHGEASYELFSLSGDTKWLIIAAERGVQAAISELVDAYDRGLYDLKNDPQAKAYWVDRLEKIEENGAAQ